MNQILRLFEIKKALGLSGSTIYRLISQGTFPKQIKLGKRSSGWLKSEVDEWFESRVNDSRTKQKGKRKSKS